MDTKLACVSVKLSIFLIQFVTHVRLRIFGHSCAHLKATLVTVGSVSVCTVRLEIGAVIREPFYSRILQWTGGRASN
jgi:hypothetical protein